MAPALEEVIVVRVLSRVVANGVDIVPHVEIAPPLRLASHSLVDEELCIVIERLKHAAFLVVIRARELHTRHSLISPALDRDGIVEGCAGVEDLIDDLSECDAVHERNVVVDQQVAEETEDLFQILQSC